jgi:PAS domain S-box-containing protein
MGAAREPKPAHTGDQTLAGGGEMGARMRAHDWASTPLGPVEQWPQSLKTAVRILLTSRQAMFVWWGGELINLYNDAYKAIVGGKHPEALGQPAAEVWREIWDQVGPRAETAMRSNEGTYDEALLLIMERYGYPEETYYTFSYSPIPNDQGGSGGIICANTDDTQRIIGERQLALLRELAACTAEARTIDAACDLSARGLATNPLDLPFALIYLIDPDAGQVTLASASGIVPGHPAAPERAALDAPTPWPFGEVARTQQAQIVDVPAAWGDLPRGAWDRPPHQAVALPIASAGQTGRAGILVAGLSPFRRYDDGYRGFIELVAAQLAASLANAQAYEEERQRAEALAELDRAKTNFFSNISHEFRTPLTLMLGPLEDLLQPASGAPAAAEHEQIEVVYRNALRLLKLVNTLLDFSRIEAGRIQAAYQPTDLAELTAELASVFRSAVERAGLKLVVDCPPLPEPVYVDREMWEKIVFNLLSNALKFTFEGAIEVVVRKAGSSAELTVRDTGTGIPPDELPRLFERFHRVSGARGRTFEGTGIGLALVQELARLHGGEVRVESTLGRGSAFHVTIPLGAAHLPADRIGHGGAQEAQSHNLAYVEEALRWLPEGQEPRTENQEPLEVFQANGSQFSVLGSSPGGRILLADDNADMREYVRRLLSGRYTIETVADGAAALAAARERPPDLLITDVMMPQLDGFGLLHELRADPRTSEVPVVLLSARAGEEARVEGLAAGADDYLVKPFSARELLARVESLLELARLRRESTRALRDREEALRRSDAEFRQLAASVPQLIWTASELGEVNFLNEQWRDYTGVAPTDLYGWRWMELVHPDDRPHTEMIWQAHLSSGAPVEVRHRLRHHSGEWRWQLVRGLPLRDERGQAIKWFGSCTDIHEQEQARRDAQFLASLAETIRLSDDPDALPAEVVAQVGEYLTVTRCYFAQIDEQGGRWIVEADYHASGASIAGEHSLAIMAPEVTQALRAGHVHAISDAQADPTTAQIYSSAYMPFETRARIAVPFLRQGRWVSNLVVASDTPRVWQPREVSLLEAVAERVWLAIEKLRSEQALRANEERLQLLYAQEQAARQQAEVASRLKDEFLATVSHELRTPLTSILGYAQLIMARKRDEAYIARTLETIVRSAKSQAQLIEDLLDVSRIVTGKLRIEPRSIDMGAVIQGAIEAVRPALDAKSIRLELELNPSGHLIGDPSRLQQVVWNLLSNAAKFTPPGGEIRVRFEASAAEARLTISDTGQGISAEFLPYVFDRFRQAESASNRTHGGLGLGLSIVRHLVEMHGGAVQAHSDGEGQGTTFTVSLPLATAPAVLEGDGRAADEPAPAGDADCPPELAGIRVLIVDDQPDILELLRDILAPCGAVVRSCSSARDALDTLGAWRPDILVSDIAMPGDDGYWLIRNVRALDPTEGGATPAVALTAYVRVEDRLQVLAAGFQMYVPKPVDPVDLRNVLAHLSRDLAGQRS